MDEVVAIVRTEEPNPGSEDGVKLAVAPAGNPLLTAKATLLEPPSDVRLMLRLVELPRFTATEGVGVKTVKSLSNP